MSRMNINIDCSTGVITKKPFTAEEETERDLLEASLDPDPPAYSSERKKEYLKLNQFELISDDSINGTTTHKDAIIAIKTKYPKG